MPKHGRAVLSQDQAHVADKLFSKFGAILCTGDILEKLASIGTDLRRF